MLGGIGRRPSKESVNTVFIQMKKGVETKKAFNHNTGDTLPKREFFGVTNAEAKRIANEIKQETTEETSTQTSQSKLTINDLLSAINLLDLEQVE